MSLRCLFRFTPVLLVALVLTACASTNAGDNSVVTVSIAPLRYVVQHIAGNRLAVNVLTPDGASPETYQPTPRQLAELSESRLYVRIGTLGFERTQLKKLVANAPHLTCVEASQGLRLIADGHSDHADGGDPHTWTSPANMRVIAGNVARALATIDSVNAGAYADGLRRIEAHLDSLDEQLRGILAAVPSRAFLVYHPALAYFAEAYGLRQFSVEHDGKDPSADHLAQLIDTCRREKVGVVFVQREHSGQAARTIAHEIGARVVEINLLSEDYDAELLRIAQALSGQDTPKQD